MELIISSGLHLQYIYMFNSSLKPHRMIPYLWLLKGKQLLFLDNLALSKNALHSIFADIFSLSDYHFSFAS